MKIIAYNKASESAKLLATELGVRRVGHTGPPINVKDTLVNWGMSVFPERVTAAITINHPTSVATAANKLEAFITMMDTVNVPMFTASRGMAQEWLKEGVTVVARTKLNGHSGDGIVIIQPENFRDAPFVQAPLYTQYVKKSQEYRIHVHKGVVFFVQRKARNLGVADENVNWQVRNHANGFIYANQDVEVADEAKIQAVAACAALGLDFGAVDIIRSTTTGEWLVLEVNTAPGLSGTTLDKYVEQFKEYK